MAERRSTLRRRVLTVLAVLATLYAALCIAARLWYPRVLFPAPRVDRAPEDLATRLVELPQDDGGGPTKALWFPPPNEAARVVVLFHGNGETIFDDAPVGEMLSAGGLGVMLVEYRGYGITYGPPPSEPSLYADGEAAMKKLASFGIPNDRITVWGISLGTSVASEMARRGHGTRLALVAPFTSIVDVGKRIAPFLPVSLLMAHRLDTLSRAKDIAQPTLVVHGDQDELVPFDMGETVSRAVPHGRLMRIAGGHHNDVLTADVVSAIVTHLTTP